MKEDFISSSMAMGIRLPWKGAAPSALIGRSYHRFRFAKRRPGPSDRRSELGQRAGHVLVAVVGAAVREVGAEDVGAVVVGGPAGGPRQEQVEVVSEPDVGRVLGRVA